MVLFAAQRQVPLLELRALVKELLDLSLEELLHLTPPLRSPTAEEQEAQAEQVRQADGPRRVDIWQVMFINRKSCTSPPCLTSLQWVWF